MYAVSFHSFHLLYIIGKWLQQALTKIVLLSKIISLWCNLFFNFLEFYLEVKQQLFVFVQQYLGDKIFIY